MVKQTIAGGYQFRLFMPDATKAEIVGTFTNWNERPIAMEATGGGWWTATVPLPPGDHEFQYFVDGRLWIADYAAQGLRMNSYGKWVSLLSTSISDGSVSDLAAAA